MKKIVLFLGILVFSFLVFRFTGLHEFANLQSLKQVAHNTTHLYMNNPVLIIIIFFMSYVVITSLSIPITAFLTILGGAIFGFTISFIVVSFASALGVLFSFLIARYFLRDTLTTKFNKQFVVIDKKFQEEGLLYLFALRVIPIFPVFLVNIIMSLTKVKAVNFYWVSQVGMLAGTALYVNLGVQLQNLTSLSLNSSIYLIGSLVLLGIFPFIAKKILRRFVKNV